MKNDMLNNMLQRYRRVDKKIFSIRLQMAIIKSLFFHSYRNGKHIIKKVKAMMYTQCLLYLFLDANALNGAFNAIKVFSFIFSDKN